MTARSSTAPSRIDWPTVHATVLEIFARGWQRPGLHAWDGFLAEDVELVQPLQRYGVRAPGGRGGRGGRIVG